VEFEGDSVKSCTMLAVQADAGRVTTIEGLGSVEALHRCSRPSPTTTRCSAAGFCTQGWSWEPATSKNPCLVRDEYREWLDGNLCRCTGYNNIVAAIASAARELAPGAAKGDWPVKPFAYHRPASVGEAAALLGARGTPASPGMTPIPSSSTASPRRTHSSTWPALPRLRVSKSGDAIRIGAMTTHSTVANSPVVCECLPSVAELAGGIGDAQVRHRGTLGARWRTTTRPRTTRRAPWPRRDNRDRSPQPGG
jgi:carbon-monoxide dehydrogenase small subunit